MLGRLQKLALAGQTNGRAALDRVPDRIEIRKKITCAASVRQSEFVLSRNAEIYVCGSRCRRRVGWLGRNGCRLRERAAVRGWWCDSVWRNNLENDD
jgi:hypothetical protein